VLLLINENPEAKLVSTPQCSLFSTSLPQDEHLYFAWKSEPRKLSKNEPKNAHKTATAKDIPVNPTKKNPREARNTGAIKEDNVP
jgi:hypothetical protein